MQTPTADFHNHKYNNFSRQLRVSVIVSLCNWYTNIMQVQLTNATPVTFKTFISKLLQADFTETI